MATVSFESVAAAAEALAAEGKRPSVRNVRAHLGGGSPNDITLFLQQWKAGRPVVRADDVAIDPRINQIVAEQISRAVAEARAEIQAQLSDAEQDNEVIGAAGREAEALATKLAGELDTAKSHIQAQVGQIDQLKADAERVKADAVSQVRQAEERAAGETAAREAAQIALAKDELRLEAVPRIEAEIEKLRAELLQARTQAAELHEAAAVANARYDAEHAARERLEAQLANAATREVAAAQALTHERACAQSATARLEAAARELTAAQEVAKEARAGAKKSGEEAAELRGQLAAKAKEKPVTKKPAKVKAVTPLKT